jgi:hypothetical protein
MMLQRCSIRLRSDLALGWRGVHETASGKGRFAAEDGIAVDHVTRWLRFEVLHLPPEKVRRPAIVGIEKGEIDASRREDRGVARSAGPAVHGKRDVTNA